MKNSDEESFASVLGSPRGGIRTLERSNSVIQSSLSAANSHIKQLVDPSGNISAVCIALVILAARIFNREHEIRRSVSDLLFHKCQDFQLLASQSFTAPTNCLVQNTACYKYWLI